jgi:hypothetical protein
LKGSIDGLAAELNLPVLRYHPSTIKMLTTGSGRASKEQVMACVERRYGIKCNNFDESDAVAVAMLVVQGWGCLPPSVAKRAAKKRIKQAERTTKGHPMTDWTKERIEAELKVCDAATKGPWDLSYPNRRSYEPHQLAICETSPSWQKDVVVVATNGKHSHGRQIRDAQFIASARTNYPSALRELLAMQERLAETEKEIDVWVDDDPGTILNGR